VGSPQMWKTAHTGPPIATLLSRASRSTPVHLAVANAAGGGQVEADDGVLRAIVLGQRARPRGGGVLDLGAAARRRVPRSEPHADDVVTRLGHHHQLDVDFLVGLDGERAEEQPAGPARGVIESRRGQAAVLHDDVVAVALVESYRFRRRLYRQTSTKAHFQQN
jgi:hypothetical protein